MLEIRLEQFEGPLGLLLKLIEKEEMDVTEISLANVADQFVEYIRQADNLNPEEMADFLVVAAKLLLAKSKALLPYLYPEEDEEVEDLERQLKMYKEFLEATAKIEKILGKKKFMFPREFNRKAAMTGMKSFSPPQKLTKNDMGKVFADLIDRLRPPEKMKEETLDHKISIEDRIVSLQQMVMEKIKFNFSRFIKTAQNKTEVIVSFLAALEMMRQREIVISQEVMFGDIYIKKNNICQN